MSQLQFPSGLHAAVALLALACARGDYYRPPPISGVQFYARADLKPAGGDTLRVRLSARNRARVVREINIGGCGHPIAIRVASADARHATWDSWAWREAEIARLNARRDTTADGHPILHGACTLAQRVQYLAPGDSADVAEFSVPVRAVLGDSLWAGRYRIQARARGNAWKAGYFGAGEVEFRPPPT